VTDPLRLNLLQSNEGLKFTPVRQEVEQRECGGIVVLSAYGELGR